MRKLLFSAAVMASLVPSGAFAVPSLPETGQTVTEPSPVEKARLFCYNRYTGRFKYWGACRSSSLPRVYCRSNYSGRFLHWGSC